MKSVIVHSLIITMEINNIDKVVTQAALQLRVTILMIYTGNTFVLPA